MGRRARRLLLTIAALLVLVTIAVSCARTSPPTAEESQIAAGRTTYTSTCMSCHGGVVGGSMMDYPPRHNANGHTWHHPDCELAQIIKNGGNAMTEAMRQMMAPPDAPKMPSFRDSLSDKDIAAVLAFIKTMWTEDERRFQAQVTKESC